MIKLTRVSDKRDFWRCGHFPPTIDLESMGNSGTFHTMTFGLTFHMCDKKKMIVSLVAVECRETSQLYYWTSYNWTYAESRTRFQLMLAMARHLKLKGRIDRGYTTCDKCKRQSRHKQKFRLVMSNTSEHFAYTFCRDCFYCEIDNNPWRYRPYD